VPGDHGHGEARKLLFVEPAQLERSRELWRRLFWLVRRFDGFTALRATFQNSVSTATYHLGNGPSKSSQSVEHDTQLVKESEHDEVEKTW
jgi:hypothetical protein